MKLHFLEEFKHQPYRNPDSQNRSEPLRTAQIHHIRMSSGKWETVNGTRYPVEDNLKEEKTNDQSFTYDEKAWDVVRELTVEEAKAITGTQKKDWSEATDEELMVFTLGYGDPRIKGSLSGPIIVDMDDDKVQLPFGFIETAPLLELLWRKTGADCPGEEADLEFPHGTYRIRIKD